MKYLLSILILLLFFHPGYAEGIDKEENNEDHYSSADSTSGAINPLTANTTLSPLEYQLRYQNFKNEFKALDISDSDSYDMYKRKKKRRRRSGTVDESLIYFSAGTGVLILTPTILSAVDKDVSIGGALAADFILAGILTYAILKETR